MKATKEMAEPLTVPQALAVLGARYLYVDQDAYEDARKALAFLTRAYQEQEAEHARLNARLDRAEATTVMLDGGTAALTSSAVAAALALLQSSAPEWKPTHRHKVRGSQEQVLGHASLQNATGRLLVEGDDMVVYRGEDGKWWVRHDEEFNDGRFETFGGDNRNKSGTRAGESR